MMLIFNSSLTVEERKGLVARIKELLSKHAQGKVAAVDDWGKRGLSYEINKQKEGVYEVWKILAEPAGLVEFNKRLRREEGVLRFLITRV